MYDELELTGEVLDICSSWISHFRTAPRRLVAMGMNETELRANVMATSWVIQDLCAIVDAYFDLTGGFDPAVVQRSNPGSRSDPALRGRRSTLSRGG